MRTALLATLITTVVTSATDLHVAATAPSGGNGLSWATAFTDVQDALDAARDDPNIAAIHVAAGTYFPDRGTGDPNQSFELVDGVSLLGGFPAAGGTLAERDPANHPTILAGDLLGDDQPPNEWGLLMGLADNTRHIVRAANCGPATLLDGFTLRGGNADPHDTAAAIGGGLLIVGGSPTVQHCRFERSRAAQGGGGLGALDATPLIQHCEFVENVGDSYGGGIAIAGTVDAEIRVCTFTANIGGSGAGIYCGPVRVLDGPGNQTVVVDCEFTANNGTIGATAGGGIMFRRGHNTARNCRFIDNRANGGGGIHVSEGDAYIERCTFFGNTGDGDGGGAIGVQNFDTPTAVDTTTIVSCLLAGNNGAVLVSSCNVQLINCTVVDNQLPDTPTFLAWPALFCDDGDFQIANCIVWGNPDLDFWGGVRDYLAGGLCYTVHNSIIEDWDGTLPGDALNTDPHFFDPTGPDGVAAQCADNNYRLRLDSPARDFGLDGALPVDALFDVDGRARISDGDGDGGAIVDAGAFERCRADLNADAYADLADVEALFAAWLGPDTASITGDLDADGDTDLRDAAAAQWLLLGGCD